MQCFVIFTVSFIQLLPLANNLLGVFTSGFDEIGKVLLSKTLGSPPYDRYVDELKAVAKSMGYSAEDIDELLEVGFSPNEIEESLYCMEVFCERIGDTSRHSTNRNSMSILFALAGSSLACFTEGAILGASVYLVAKGAKKPLK